MALDEDSLTNAILDAMAELDKKFNKSGPNADRFPRAIARAVILELTTNAVVTGVTVDITTGTQLTPGTIS